MNNLTDRQAQIWLFVRQFTREHGYAPSYKEIAAAADVSSTNGIAYSIGRLALKGWIRYTPGTVRSLVTLIPEGMTEPVR